MNKTALITIGKKLRSNDLYLISVFDLEPSGVIVHAYSQIDSKEFSLPISETEFSKAGLSRNNENLNKLLESIELIPQGESYVLRSTIDEISDIKHKISASTLENVLSEELVPGAASLNEVLVDGLVELCKVKPVGLDAVAWLGNWLIENNPSKPRVEVPE